MSMFKVRGVEGLLVWLIVIAVVVVAALYAAPYVADALAQFEALKASLAGL